MDFNEDSESKQVDDSDVAGMGLDNCYYLTFVLSGHEYKALLNPGVTVSLTLSRVIQLVKVG